MKSHVSLSTIFRRIISALLPGKSGSARAIPVRVRSNAAKRTFVVLILVASSLSTASAQYFGLRGGVERTQIVSDLERNTIGTETGYTIGAFVNIPLPKHFGLSVEGMYSQKVVTQQNLVLATEGELSPDASLNLGYIQIPITLSYTLQVPGPIKPRFYGGPVVGVLVDESIDLKGKKATDVANEATVLTKDAFADREIGWTAGVGASLRMRPLPIYLIFDMRYIGGVSTISNDFAGNPLGRNLEIGAFAGSIGIAF